MPRAGLRTEYTLKKSGQSWDVGVIKVVEHQASHAFNVARGCSLESL